MRRVKGEIMEFKKQFTNNQKTIADIPAELEKFLANQRDGVKLSIEVKPHKESRTLSANAYLWVLCDKIASVVGITKTEVYQTAVREVGRFTHAELTRAQFAKFKLDWEKIGIGWFVDIVDDLGDVIEYQAYWGSSNYDVAEMTRLIDHVVTDAKELEIETKTPAEIAELISLGEVAR